VEQNTRVRLNFDSFELGELEVRSVDWCLEASGWNFDCLQEISTIAEGLGYDVGSVPFRLQLGGMRLG